jgi:hypothetical protein
MLLDMYGLNLVNIMLSLEFGEIIIQFGDN